MANQDKCEKETVITFNQEDKDAIIFTYEKTWQRYIEKILKIVPIFDNGVGGREYLIDKRKIPKPRKTIKDEDSEKLNKVVKKKSVKVKKVKKTRKVKSSRVNKKEELNGKLVRNRKNNSSK